MGTRDILQELKKTYSAISAEFDATRNRPWPEFKIFLNYLQAGEGKCRLCLLDVGCGNGRLADFFRGQPIRYTGVDNNRMLLSLARKNHPAADFRFAEITRPLPFPARSFDTVWCIAVLHHLPTATLRREALRQIKKVLRKKGTIMFTVWNLLPQKKYHPYLDPKTHDARIPWGKEKKQTRYYHAFTLAELTALTNSAGFSVVKKIRNPRNLAVIAEKP